MVKYLLLVKAKINEAYQTLSSILAHISPINVIVASCNITQNNFLFPFLILTIFFTLSQKCTFWFSLMCLYIVFIIVSYAHQVKLSKKQIIITQRYFFSFHLNSLPLYNLKMNFPLSLIHRQQFSLLFLAKFPTPILYKI